MMIALCMSNDKKSFQKVVFGVHKDLLWSDMIFFSKQINKLCATTVEYNLRDKYNDNYQKRDALRRPWQSEFYGR